MTTTSSSNLEDRRFTISLFANQFDNKPSVRDFRYQALIKMLGCFEERGEKGGQAFSPVSYSEPVRSNRNVEKVTLALVDYDDGTTIQQAQARFKPFEYLLYTSFSHTLAHNRFRLVFPLERAIAAEDWECAWQHLAKLAPGLDGSCNDLARIYYLPTHRPDAEHLSLRNRGKLLDLPTTPPVGTRKRQRRGCTRMKVGRDGEIKKAPYGGRIYTGAAKSLGDWLDQHRVEWKPLDRGGRRYLALDECPWEHEHSQKSKPGDTVVFEGDGGKWCFHCFHAHCSERGWRDFRAQVERAA
jgi:hypothetical protein